MAREKKQQVQMPKKKATNREKKDWVAGQCH